MKNISKPDSDIKIDNHTRYILTGEINGNNGISMSAGFHNQSDDINFEFYLIDENKAKYYVEMNDTLYSSSNNIFYKISNLDDFLNDELIVIGICYKKDDNSYIGHQTEIRGKLIKEKSCVPVNELNQFIKIYGIERLYSCSIMDPPNFHF